MAILAAKEWLQIWEEWTALENVLVARYEDLLDDPRGEVERLLQFLSLPVAEQEVEQIVAAYQTNEDAAKKDEHLGLGMHFHKGISGRFRTMMTDEQLALCDEQFGRYLPGMGYPAE